MKINKFIFLIDNINIFQMLDFSLKKEKNLKSG